MLRYCALFMTLGFQQVFAIVDRYSCFFVIHLIFVNIIKNFLKKIDILVVFTPLVNDNHWLWNRF